MNKALRDAQIQLERQRGELLGTLVDRWGAEAVVEALGVKHVACSLGVPTISHGGFYGDEVDD